jgi:hypothetical protein
MIKTKNTNQNIGKHSQGNNVKKDARVLREKEEDYWSNFRRRPEKSFKKLPERNETRDWWIGVVSVLLMFGIVVWFGVRDNSEAKEFIRLFSIITGSMFMLIFGFRMLAWILRELGLKLGFRAEILDRRYGNGWYGYW